MDRADTPPGPAAHFAPSAAPGPHAASLVDAPDLAALEHENLTGAIRIVAAEQPRGLVRIEGGVALLASGLPMRLFNQVVIAGEAPSLGAVAAAVATARDRRDRFVVHLRLGIDDAVEPTLRDLGLEPADGLMPGMAYRPVGAPPSAVAGLEIRCIDTAAGLADHRRVVADGFGLAIEIVDAVMSGSVLESKVETVYVGYEEGRPVTAGMGFRTGDAIGVYNIATVPGARGRGYGAAITGRVVADGLLAGCAVAVLQASEMGRPIYERMGFREVVTYRAWIDPAERG